MKLFAPTPRHSVAALGEARLIARIRRWLGRACPPSPAGIGDDCAVLPEAAGAGARLVTVDPVVYGRHFDDRLAPAAAGAKLLKRNLSDIAAMGGRPEAAVVALALDPRVRVAWLEEFYRGLAAAARRYRVAIVGGDVAQAPGVFVATLTLLGSAGSTGRRTPLLRTGGRIGDVLYVTGELGASVASGHHHRFAPRLAEGAWLARQPAVRAMMDISDGLAKDLHAVTPAGAAPVILASQVPRRRGADLQSALTEGEDYELLVVADRRADLPAFERAWRRAFRRVRLTRIGEFRRAGKAVPGAVNLDHYRGYEHLR
jgi:thiamine-monophosphate kinase